MEEGWVSGNKEEGSLIASPSFVGLAMTVWVRWIGGCEEGLLRCARNDGVSKRDSASLRSQ